MKKALLLLLTLFILPNICSTAFSKENDKALKQIEKIRKTQKASAPNSNAKQKQQDRLKPSEKLQQRRQKLRERRRQQTEKIRQRKDDPTAKQAEALKKKIIHEEAKHRRRKARLNRIRQLALEKNATETVQRIDDLLKKEQTRYVNKQQKMRLRRQP